jgi:acyl-CoA synthetase (AMP-forming)/AMP-acid ligase II
VRSLASGLTARGLRRGDRLAILDDNSLEFFELVFAAAGAGLVLCPLNPRSTARELAIVLDEAEPRLVACRAELAGRVEEARVLSKLATRAGPATRSLDRLWLDEDPHASGGSAGPSPDTYTACLAADAREFRPAEVGAGDLAQLYFTSGTSGRPKGVMLTHGNLAAHAAACVAELRLCASDVWGHFAPMFHLADAWAVLALTSAGGSHVLVPRFDAGRVWAAMHEHRVTLTNLVPTMIVRLLEEVGNRPRRPPALRLCLSGGAPIAPAVVRRLVEELGCEYAQTYGMTETCPFLTISLLGEQHAALGEAERMRLRAKTGRPFAGVELEVLDADGRPVARDERAVGEIRVRGASVSPGYWRRPEETAAAFRDGWLYTGDLAVVDREGYLTIVDRKKDVILTGGETVYSTEVEKALHEHPDVFETAAFGLPDPEWGEIVCAAVVARAGKQVTEAELVDHLRARLSAFKCPKRFFHPESLPRTASGKISKAALRERYSPR